MKIIRKAVRTYDDLSLRLCILIFKYNALSTALWLLLV